MKFPFHLALYCALLGSCAQKPSPIQASMLSKASFAFPVYPKSEGKAGRGGKVVVQMDVDRRGKIVHARIKSSTNPALNQACLDAARASRFPADPARPEIVQANKPYIFSSASPRTIAEVNLEFNVNPQGKAHNFKVRKTSDPTANQAAIAQLKDVAFPPPENPGQKFRLSVTVM